MFARTSASVCLLLSLCSTPPAPAAAPESRVLFVYLSAAPGANAPELDYMRSETGALMRSAGYRLEWRTLDAASKEDAPDLVIVKLTGDCTAPRIPQPPTAGAGGGYSLASTATSSGVVLPFSEIHCSALTRALSPAFSGVAPAERSFLYGRAMGRVLAHELYHVLAHTGNHTREGLGKPSYNLGDLVDDHLPSPLIPNAQSATVDSRE